jgi:hypothetical protein
LILCWYSPVETIMLSHFNTSLKTVLPMLILCPPCIAAALAFVVYSLKSRCATVSATLLSLALFARQQALHGHHMGHRGDWFAMSSALNLLVTALAYWLYRRRVVWAPEADNNEPQIVVDLQT